MISHLHKCIFIHITKCAGSSVEHGLGGYYKDTRSANYENAFGWCPKLKLFMQHATPQQMLDTGLIKRADWDQYYKFIVVRNPWERAYSDYFWVMRDSSAKGSFDDFIRAKGKFSNILIRNPEDFRGEHLYQQKDYFFVDGTPIHYDSIIRYEALTLGLETVAQDLNLPPTAFASHINQFPKRISHYSHFYSDKRKRLVETEFKHDISFLNYVFEDRRTPLTRLRALTPSLFALGGSQFIKMRYPVLHQRLKAAKKSLFKVSYGS